MMIMKSSTSFCFSSLLLFFFIVASMAVDPEDICTYQLIVRTGIAGTDSRISVTIGNVAGERLEIPDLEKTGVMKPGYKYFQIESADYFNVTSSCFRSPAEPPCQINVTTDGSGKENGWFLEHVEVLTFDPRKPTHPKIIFWIFKYLALDWPQRPYELSASVNECKSKYQPPFNVLRSWD